jgi:hypothetical protein
MMNWVELIKEVGPYLGLMFFFIWRDYRREEMLVKRNHQLDDFIQKELVECIEKTTEALRHVKS